MMMDKLDLPRMTLSTPEVVLSLPEVNALCARAARGAGYSWGISEECGHAAAWLASYGFDWATVLIRRLNGDRGADVTPAPGEWKTAGPACSLYAGATLADFAALPEGPGGNGVMLGDIHDPLLLLPFAARAAQSAGFSLRCSLNSTPWFVLSARSVAEIEPGLNTTAMSRCELRVIQTVPDSSLIRVRNTAPVSHDDYAQLSAIALRMTVPETAASEARAGGAGSDND